MTEYYIQFDSLDSLEKEIEYNLKSEVDDFLSQGHLVNLVLPEKYRIISNFLSTIMDDISKFVTNTFDTKTEELINEINESLIDDTDTWNTIDDENEWDSGAPEKEVWDSSNESWKVESDIDIEKELEEFANELDQFEKKESTLGKVDQQEEKEEENSEPVNWGPDWEGF